VLGMRQLRPPGIACKRHEVTSDDWYRASRTLLPRRVSSRVDDYLTHDPPTRVVRIAPRDEKPRERIGHALRPRVGRVAVQMP
jgi:hypothetical protein